jgi:hypothetical protein
VHRKRNAIQPVYRSDVENLRCVNDYLGGRRAVPARRGGKLDLLDGCEKDCQ